MSKKRIVQVTFADDRKIYRCEQKRLWWWETMCDLDYDADGCPMYFAMEYRTLEEARERLGIDESKVVIDESVVWESK